MLVTVHNQMIVNNNGVNLIDIESRLNFTNWFIEN